MPQKILDTRSFDEYEPGATVTYWTNAPTGKVRKLQRATAKLQIRNFAKNPASPQEFAEVLAAVESALEADDAVWEAVLELIDSWTLKGWSDDVLPLTLEGLDELEGATRLAVLNELSEALAGVRKLDPKPVSPSSLTEAASSASDESDGERNVRPLQSPYHPASSETG